MSLLSQIKNSLKKAEARAYNFIYSRPNFTGLRLLAKIYADVWFLPLYFFTLQNRKRLGKYLRIRLSGAKPKVVFVTTEGDGRFRRLLQLTDAGPQDKVFVFEMPIMCFATELRFFQDHFWEFCKTTGRNDRYVDVFACYYDEANQKNRVAYRKVAGQILSIFRFFFDPKLIVSGSGADHYAVELIRIARARGVKWMICEREGSQSKHQSVVLGKLFAATNPLIVDSIVVTNPLHEQSFKIASNHSPETNVIMLGELRSDRWVDVARKKQFTHPFYNEWNKFEKKVLFLVFGERSYIEPMDHPHISGDWCALLVDMEDVMLDFAMKNPNSLVFYKMGHMEDNNAAYLKRVADAGLKNVVALDRIFPCEELIQYSDLIVGFQTTAVFESMFTDKPIFYPFWHFPPEVNPDVDILPIHSTGAVYTITSKEMFLDYMQKWQHDSLPPLANQAVNRKKWREYYFHQPDGHVSERVIDEIYRLIGEK